MKNKILVMLLAMIMLTQVTSTANAIDTNGGAGETSAILNQEQTSFNVTVPTSLPIAVDSYGNVTTATDVELRNNSYGPIVISDIQVDVANGWSLVDFDKDMSKSKLGLKEFGFSIQNDKVQPNGSVALTPSSWESIPGNGSIYLNYDANVSPQKTALLGINIANVVFTLGWDETTKEVPKYTLANDDDFIKTSDYARDYFQYIGTDEYVDIPHIIQGENVDSYYSMFKETSVKGVKSTNTSVTDMNSMFLRSQATTLDLSSFDTSNVTSMYAMFSGSQATTLDLSSFDTSNVTTMSNMFSGCSNLTTLNLSIFDTSNVTSMNDMFGDDRNLATLDLSSFDTSNVTDMSSMFFACKTLETLDLSSFDTSNVTNMEAIFYNCTTLQTVYARAEADAQKIKSSPLFPSQAQVIVKPSETETEPSKYVTATDDDFINIADYFQYIGTDEYVEIPHVIQGENVTSYAGMFSGKSVKGVKSTNTNVTNMTQMFDNSAATTLDLSSFDTSSVTDMSYMFRGSKATTLDLSSFDTTSVETMGFMFSESAATSIDLSSFNTSKVIDMERMFWNSAATSLDLSSFDTSFTPYMSYMFWNSAATTGYARTEADAGKFNATAYKPEGLTFIVK